LTQAQHPKTVDLLQKALDKSKEDFVSHQQPAAAVQAVRAKPKTEKPSTYYVPINSYGELTWLNKHCISLNCAGHQIHSIGSVFLFKYK